MARMQAMQPTILFTREDHQGKVVHLQHYEGKRVLLSFFRGASCPFCNLRVRELIKRYPELHEAGVEVLAIFSASAEEIARYAGQEEPPFAVIPDPEMELYRKYGVEQSQMAMFRAMAKPRQMMRVMSSRFFTLKSMKDKPIVPADFLIDEKQRIYRAYYGRDFGDHLPLDQVIQWKKR